MPARQRNLPDAGEVRQPRWRQHSFPPPPSRTQLEPAQLCACGTAAAVPRGRAARADRALRKPLAPLNGWTAFRISLGQGGLAPTRPDPTPSADTAPRCFHAFLNSLQRQKVLRPGLCAAGYIFAAQGFLAMTFGAHGLLPACAADSVRARAVAQNTRRVFCASTFMKTSDRIDVSEQLSMCPDCDSSEDPI